MAKTTRKRAKAAPETDALKSEAVARASTNDPQSGGAMVAGPEPTVAAVKRARKEATEAQFAEADAKGAPTLEELEEIRIGQEIRGY